VGITLNLVPSPDSPTHTQKQTSGSWSGLIRATRGMEYLDPMAAQAAFVPGSGLNFGNVDDPVLTDLFSKQQLLLGEERREVLVDIWNHLLAEMHEITDVSSYFLSLWKPTLKNWRDTPWNAGFGA